MSVMTLSNIDFASFTRDDFSIRLCPVDSVRTRRVVDTQGIGLVFFNSEPLTWF
jgi:hypothetical protein